MSRVLGVCRDCSFINTILCHITLCRIRYPHIILSVLALLSCLRPCMLGRLRLWPKATTASRIRRARERRATGDKSLGARISSESTLAESWTLTITLPVQVIISATQLASMSLPPPEVVQAYILNTLSTNGTGTIDDSRTITYNGAELRSAEEQAVVKGVLDSLWSKEVSAGAILHP